MTLMLRRNKLCSQFLVNLSHKESEIINKIHWLSINDLIKGYWKKKKSPCIAECYRELAEYKETLHTTPINLNYIFNIAQLKNLKRNFLRDYSNYPTRIRDVVFKADIKKLSSNAYQIYTDASKSTKGTACAIYDPQTNESKMFKLNANSSIYSAELIGILEALKYCQHLPNKKIYIFSDSKN
uniref:Uncharacterized protein LOC114343795 n=1 Tax=Diabrotica virgifera virgifera TaxID=50390 RepID=A0A6P7GKJ4_DIAVI